jgi:hypothetical protein
MIAKIEAYLFGQVWGRYSARFAVGAAGFLVAKLASIGVQLDPVATTAVVGALLQAAYSGIKGWRDKRAAAAVAAVRG